jgi:hypothetical protein
MANFIQKYPTSRQGTTQTVTFAGSSGAAGNAFGSQTRQIRVVADSACNYRISDGGSATAATTSDPFLPANWVEYLTVQPGEWIAAIRAASDGLVTATSGTLWITELS